MKSKIVLASASPRRREICQKYGLNPIIMKPNLEEEKDLKSDGPYEMVMGLSFQKAESIAKDLKDEEIVMASDTIVYFQGEKLGKPRDEKNAYDILKSLSGKTHSAITGIALIKAGTNEKIIDYVETKVKFKELSHETINNYIATREPMDKAGAYGIQGWGQLLVEEIQGSYLNVVGFPIEKVADLLEKYFEIKLM